MAFDRERMKVNAIELATRGVFIGTSSWKYDGWFGQLYTPARYEYRGKAIRQNVGVVMFEFSRFHQSDYEHGRDFVADLDKFFGALPKDWPYAVEMRNKHWLAPEYFACL